jgi:CheY-like chemotaxis protein
VAQEHGGRLEVHHLPDRGTRFELVIPIDTGLSAIEQRRESHPISEAPLKRSRLLIVDDDAMVLSALRRRLRRRYDTVTVLGGAEALARLSEDPGFDSIVCDLMMPEVDGKSFYNAIKKDHPELADRIVFMSGGAFTPRLHPTPSCRSPSVAKTSSRCSQRTVTRSQATDSQSFRSPSSFILFCKLLREIFRSRAVCVTFPPV